MSQAAPARDKLGLAISGGGEMRHELVGAVFRPGKGAHFVRRS